MNAHRTLNPKRPTIKTRKEWSETVGAWLVSCYVNRALYNALFTEEPDATARALAYEAASAF